MADRIITIKDIESRMSWLEQYENAVSKLITALQQDEAFEKEVAKRTDGAVTSLELNGLRNTLISYRSFFRELRDNTPISSQIDVSLYSKLL